MINILELVGFSATIARLGASAHSFHHRQIELGRSVGCASVTGFRATKEVEVEVEVVVEARNAHGGDGGGVVISAGCVAG